MNIRMMIAPDFKSGAIVFLKEMYDTCNDHYSSDAQVTTEKWELFTCVIKDASSVQKHKPD